MTSPKKQDQQPDPTPPATGTDEKVIQAHVQADKDIEQDADLSIHSPNDDLDEGETARLEDDSII